ncbi:MAG: hypothetical protein WBW79_17630, partial [Desulfocapsaceae bacterium]
IYQAMQIYHRDTGLFCLPGSIFGALTEIFRRCRTDLQPWLAERSSWRRNVSKVVVFEIRWFRNLIRAGNNCAKMLKQIGSARGTVI